MKACSSRAGFTFLEIMIGMGVLVTVLAIMAGLVGVARQLVDESKVELQRAYTQKAVFELVSGSDVYSLPSSFTVDSIQVQGNELLTYEGESSGTGWQARILITEQPDGKRKVEVELVEVEGD